MNYAGEGKVLLTAEEAAGFYRVSRGWIYAHAAGKARPVLPRIKMGGRVLFRREDLEKVIEECREYLK